MFLTIEIYYCIRYQLIWAQDLPQMYTQSAFSLTATGMRRELGKLMQERLKENRAEICMVFAIKPMHNWKQQKQKLVRKTVGSASDLFTIIKKNNKYQLQLIFKMFLQYNY